MNTTSLFVDLLISGVQVGIWLCLLIASIVGFEPSALRELKGWEVTIAAILLPIVYPVGIFIDNLADDMLRPIGRRIRRRFMMDEGPTVTRLLGRKRDESLARYFDYIRTRIRISRSSIVNFTIITLCGELFVWMQWRPAFGVSRALLAWLVGILGVSLTALAWYSWYRITVSFTKKVAFGLSELAGQRGGESEEAREIAAELVT